MAQTIFHRSWSTTISNNSNRIAIAVNVLDRHLHCAAQKKKRKENNFLLWVFSLWSVTLGRIAYAIHIEFSLTLIGFNCISNKKLCIVLFVVSLAFMMNNLTISLAVWDLPRPKTRSKSIVLNSIRSRIAIISLSGDRIANRQWKKWIKLNGKWSRNNHFDWCLSETTNRKWARKCTSNWKSTAHQMHKQNFVVARTE